ncbi:MAG: hypothetical protein V1821_02815 [bacterium]
MTLTVMGVTYTKGGPNQFTYTGIPVDYRVTIDPGSDFPPDTEISVRITASDIANNEMTPYLWYFNRPPTPPPTPPTCESLGCYTAPQVCIEPITGPTEVPPECPAMPICGDGRCELPETSISCRFDCIIPLPEPTVPPAQAHILSDLRFTAFNDALAIPLQGDNSVHVLPSLSYTVYLNQKNIPQIPARVYLKSATGTYALIPRSGTSEYTTGVVSPAEIGRTEEVIYIEYPDGTSDNLAYNLVVEQPGFVYEQSGDQDQRIAGSEVTVYEHTTTGKVIWNADVFGQMNPMETAINGEFRFMVPVGGVYSLEVKKDGYVTQATAAQRKDQNVMTEPVKVAKPLGAAIQDIASSGGTVTEKITQITEVIGDSFGQSVDRLGEMLTTWQNDPEVQEAVAKFTLPSVVMVAGFNLGGLIAFTLGALLWPLLALLLLKLRRVRSGNKPLSFEEFRAWLAKLNFSLEIPLFIIVALLAFLNPSPFLIGILMLQGAGTFIYGYIYERFRLKGSYKAKPKDYLSSLWGE